MGQKTNPIGFRLGISKQWNSRYYASTKDLPALLKEDQLVRGYLKARRFRAMRARRSPTCTSSASRARSSSRCTRAVLAS